MVACVYQLDDHAPDSGPPNTIGALDMVKMLVKERMNDRIWPEQVVLGLLAEATSSSWYTEVIIRAAARRHDNAAQRRNVHLGDEREAFGLVRARNRALRHEMGRIVQLGYRNGAVYGVWRAPGPMPVVFVAVRNISGGIEHARP